MQGSGFFRDPVAFILCHFQSGPWFAVIHNKSSSGGIFRVEFSAQYCNPEPGTRNPEQSL
jgi:hypothetical protein